MQDTGLHNVTHLYIKMHIAFDSHKHNVYYKRQLTFKAKLIATVSL